MPLGVHGLASAETKRTVYRISAGIDDKPEDLLDPKWWVHVAKQLRVDSRIEVMSFDRSWFAELVVLEVGSGGFGGCRLAFILGPVALSNDREIPKPAVNEPRWGGPASKWQVVRVQDKKVLKDGFELKEEAAAWITERDKVAA